jgi:uncharacterized protein YkwD
VNLIDILLCFITLLVAFIGYKKGAVETILDLAKWLICIVCGLLVYFFTIELAFDYFPFLPDFSILYFTAVFVFVFTAMYLLLSMLQRWVFKRDGPQTGKTFANKISGIVPGLLMGIVLSLIIGRLLTFSMFDNISNEATTSEITTTFTPYTNLVEEQITPLVKNYFTPKIAAATAQPVSESDFKTETIYERPDLEYEMFLLINEERLKRGLPLLKIDEKMKQVARAHSTDMFQRGYFAHVTPEGLNPFQRIKNANIIYKKAGENLAFAKTLAEAHTGLMNSPSHRAAILNPAFKRVGIGIMDGGNNRFMFSQEFRD